MTGTAVPRLAAPLSSAAFHDTYWVARQPVVITGTADALLERHARWDPEVVFERMRAERGAVVHNLLWFDTEEGVLLDRSDLPALVADHIYGAAHVTRGRHYRLFFHGKGHTTGLHYEGNLLDVFSVQLRGARRWKLMRGDRAYKLFPFYFLENQASYAPVGDEPPWTYVIDLQPGELLFLPRGWYHYVECLSDDNVAVSLVSAPRDRAALDAVTLDTYREQLALQYYLRGVLPERFARKVETFVADDASGLSWTRHYIRGVSVSALLRRLAYDLAVVTPRMLATVLLDVRTRRYIAYLERLRASLAQRLDAGTSGGWHDDTARGAPDK